MVPLLYGRQARRVVRCLEQGSGESSDLCFLFSDRKPVLLDWAGNAWVLYGQASRAISTGKLNASPRLHIPPINLVVFKGPSGSSKLQGDLILKGASRLDAFSGYPVRT